VLWHDARADKVRTGINLRTAKALGRDLFICAKDLFGAAGRVAVAMGLLGLGPLVMPKATGAGGERAWH